VTSDEATTVTSDEATTVTSDEATTVTSDEATTVTSDEATTVTSDEATTVTSDEATTVTSDEATTVTSDEATTVTSDEVTTVTSDEVTTVTSDEATTVTSDEATTEPQQRTGPDGGAMSEPYALLVLHSLPDSQVPPLVSQRGEASMGALQSAVQRGAAAQHNPRGRTVRAAIALGGITAREVGARARSLQGLVATELGLPHAAIALLSATPHAGGVHIEFTAVAYGAAAEGLVSAIEDLNGHKIAQALALARDTERLVSATLRFTRAFVGSRGSEFRSRVQGVLADALMTQSGYVVAPDVIIDQVEHWGQVVQFKVRVGQTFQEEVVKAIQGLAVGKLEQALAWR